MQRQLLMERTPSDSTLAGSRVYAPHRVRHLRACADATSAHALLASLTSLEASLLSFSLVAHALLACHRGVGHAMVAVIKLPM